MTILARPALAFALLVAGCGGDGATSVADYVDLRGEPPFVNSMDVDPADGSLLLTTNRGFFRIAPDGSRATPVRSRAEADQGSADVGTFLEVAAVGPGRLLGSGHPDPNGRLPEYLGFMTSEDGGRTWRVVSRLGKSDLHQIRRLHGRLYAFDAVIGAVLVSRDEGRTWSERFTPRRTVTDFAVDPEDPGHLLVAAEDQLFRSRDGGDTWRPTDQAPGARLDWPEPGALLRADRDGTVRASADGGETWQRRGRVDGEPLELRALSGRRAYVATREAAIVETRDGGRTFSDRFRPGG